MRDIGSNANTKICFEVRAPCSTSPPTPLCRISNSLSVHRGLPPREPSPRRICYNTRSTELLSQTTTSQPRGKLTTNTSTEEVYNQTQSPLPKRDPNQNHPITSTEEGFTNIRVFTTMRFTTNNLKHFSFLFSFLFLFFHKNKILRV